MASLLVIGGSGFFGKSILDAYRRGLLEQWCIKSILIIARKAESLKESNPELISDSIKLINADISSCLELPRADYIIHAAASTDAANYINRPDIEKKNIQEGTYNFCRLVEKFCIDSKILYISSGAVYGKQPVDVEHITEENSYLDLESLDTHKKGYAASKRDSESAIMKLGDRGLQVSIARCFAFVGKYLPRNQHFAIGNFIEDGLNSRSIQARGVRPTYRSYMYADDLVDWMMTILKSASNTCEVFNLGSDESISIHNLAYIISERFSVGISAQPYKFQDSDKYIPSIKKARNKLGLKLNYRLTDAIDQTIQRILEVD